MNIIDVIENTEWQEPLLEQVNQIQNTPHVNNNNYTNFKKRLEEYDCFTILVEGDNILAMSGLWSGGIYPFNIVRALDRMYIFNWKKGFSWNRKYGSEYMWPYQVQRAKELGYDCVFFSIQTPKKRKIFTRIANDMNPKPEVLSTLRNTCRIMNNGEINQHYTCWQNVAIYKLNESEFPLPSMEINEFEEKYELL